MKNTKFILISFICILCIFFGTFFCLGLQSDKPTSNVTAPSNAEKRVVFLKTENDADCTLIKYNDIAILVDTGEKGDGNSVINYLEDSGITELDAIVFSHFDKDHCGGAIKILDKIKVNEIIRPSYIESKSESDKVVEKIKTLGIKETVIEKQESRNNNGLIMTFMPPLSSTYAEKQSNNSSLVLKVKIDSFTVLFTGDAQEARVGELLASTEDMSADVLKMMYHGRPVTNEKEFIETRVKPKYTIIPAESDSKKTRNNIDAISPILGEYHYTGDETVVFNLDNGTPIVTTE